MLQVAFSALQHQARHPCCSCTPGKQRAVASASLPVSSVWTQADPGCPVPQMTVVLLDAVTQAMQLITRQVMPDGHRFICEFSRTSQHIMILSWVPRAMDAVIDAELSIFGRTGQALSRFQYPTCLPSFALIQESKLAVAMPHEVGVWDMMTGQLLGSTATLATEAGCMREYQAFVAANRTGCKLAFLGACTSALHLYDAETLELLACLQPATALEHRAMDRCSGSLMWEGSQLLMLRWPSEHLFLWYRQLDVLQLSLSDGTLRQILPGEEFYGCFQTRDFVVSPDSRYVCTCMSRHKPERGHHTPDGALIRVHDMRSGLWC